MTSLTPSRSVWCWATALAVVACGGETESALSARRNERGWVDSGGAGFSEAGPLRLPLVELRRAVRRAAAPRGRNAGGRRLDGRLAEWRRLARGMPSGGASTGVPAGPVAGL